MSVKTCRHCRVNRANRPRGLCWTCYYTDGVKDRYAPVSKYGCRGVGNTFASRLLPCQPTDAEPGSPEKIAVLEGRAARGERLWHPDDNHDDGAEPPPAVLHKAKGPTFSKLLSAMFAEDQ